jgi:hypothetical protein
LPISGAKKLAFFLKANVVIKGLQTSSSFLAKNAKFWEDPVQG